MRVPLKNTSKFTQTFFVFINTILSKISGMPAMADRPLFAPAPNNLSILVCISLAALLVKVSARMFSGATKPCSIK
jgi:hypothetical protein